MTNGHPPKTRPTTLLQEAQNPSTPPERLSQLATRSVSLAHAVALNPASPPALLEALYQKTRLRRALAQNPNTPPSLLFLLLGPFPYEVWNNPSFSLLLLENPSLIGTLPRKVAEQLASRRKTPPEILTMLTSHPEWTVHYQLARNPNTPGEALAKIVLAFPSWSDIWVMIARHKNATTETLSACLFFNLSVDVQRAASKHPNAPKVLLSLLQRAGFSSRFTRPSKLSPLSAQEYEQLCGRNIELDALIAASPYAPEALVARLSESPNAIIRKGAAQNPSLSPDALERLLQDPDLSVRAAVAANTGLPSPLLHRAASDKDASVRTCVAQNRGTPAAVLQQLSHDSSSKVRVAVASHPNCPPEIRRRLDFDSNSRARAVSVKDTKAR